MGKTELAILFWTKVERLGPDECWEWLGPITREGHGIMSLWLEGNWRMKPVSHIAVFLRFGYWPKKAIKRKCKNTTCVNTDHFKLD